MLKQFPLCHEHKNEATMKEFIRQKKIPSDNCVGGRITRAKFRKEIFFKIIKSESENLSPPTLLV